jgi:hypothetical protein
LGDQIDAGGFGGRHFADDALDLVGAVAAVCTSKSML